MKIPQNAIPPSCFFGNDFCLTPNADLVFVAVSKNVVTFLKKVVIYNESGKNEAHERIGSSQKSPFLVLVGEMDNYECKYDEFKKFAIWLDPVERMVSACRLSCLERKCRWSFHFLGINAKVGFDRYMQFLKFEWGKTDPERQDEHIRRQVGYRNPDQVNYIISIKELHAFLHELSYRSLRSYRTKPKLRSHWKVNPIFSEYSRITGRTMKSCAAIPIVKCP